MTDHQPVPENRGLSVLASLRGLVPQRNLYPSQSLRVAELQARLFRQLTGSRQAALDESAVARLPRVRIVRRQLPTSGLSYWDGECWVIALNVFEPPGRQRFTLMHEYKHIIDHGMSERLYGPTTNRAGRNHAERAADYFAACALMPKDMVCDAWENGIQTFSELAELLDVSMRAIEVRLCQLHLIPSSLRHDLSESLAPEASQRSDLPDQPLEPDDDRTPPALAGEGAVA